MEKIAAQRCADTSTVWTQHREGQRVCLWSEALDAVEVKVGCQRALRRVYQLTERTLDRRGQPLFTDSGLDKGVITVWGSHR